MKLRFIMMTFVLMVSISVFSCGGDGTTIVGTTTPTITQAKAISTSEDVLIGANGIANSTVNVGSGSFLRTAMAFVAVNTDIDASGDCDGGGSIRFDGQLTEDEDPDNDPSTDAEIASGDYTMSYSSCRNTITKSVSDGSCQITVTLSGDIDVVADYEQDNDEMTISSTSEMRGTLDVTIDGATTEVTVAIDRTISVANGSATNETTGTMTIDGVQYQVDDSDGVLTDASSDDVCP